MSTKRIKNCFLILIILIIGTYCSHESPEKKTQMVDKISLRNYSKKILRKNICTPILKIYDDIDEINL